MYYDIDNTMQIFSEICKSSHPKGRLDSGDLIQPDTSSMKNRKLLR